MRGYDVLAAHHLNEMPVVPMEPCVVTQGLLSHIRFRQIMLDRLGDYPSDGEQNIPEIVRDDEILSEHANFVFANDNVHHLYVPQLHCDETNVRNFNEAIIKTARRFRVNVDKLIEKRRVLTRMADMFGDERYIKKIINGEVCAANGKAILIHLEREINWVFQNKIRYEQQIENLHFAIEALRSNLLKMFDEMFARRMGWGYEMRNPGHKFMVFVRHTPFVQSYLVPKSENTENDSENDTSTDNLRILKRSISQNCVIKVTSIDQLTELITKKSSKDFQILHFVENEEKLKLKIENLKDLYYTWVETCHGYYKGSYYDKLFDEVHSMFHAFVKDILVNSHYGSITTKSEIIADFKKLIRKEMNYNITWYWDPTASANKLKNFINEIYGHKYPKKPTTNNIPFHSEL